MFTFDEKGVVKLFAFLLLGFVLMGAALFPAVSLVYNGFAVDSQGRVYVAERAWIGVYADGEKQRDISVSHATKQGGYYEFTIVRDQIQLWGTTDARYVMDLDGRVLSTHPDYTHSTHLSSAERFQFTAENGDGYRMSGQFVGRARVIRTQSDGRESVVFRMPLSLFLLRTCIPLYWLFLLVQFFRHRFREEWDALAAKRVRVLERLRRR